MTATNPNPTAVLSRDALPITFEGVPSTAQITISAAGAEYVFAQTPVDGRVALPMADLLDALLADYSPNFTSSTFSIPEVAASATSGGESAQASLHALRGGSGGTALADLKTRWLTQRPQSCRTTLGATEPLALYVPGGTNATVRIYATCYTAMKAATEVELPPITTGGQAPAIVEVDASPAAVIRALRALDGTFESDLLMAYRITAEVYGHSSLLYSVDPQEFRLDPDDHSADTFAFLNCYGLPDTVHPRGETDTMPEAARLDFTSNSETLQALTSRTVKRKTRSGRLATPEEELLWKAFLLAPAHWVLRDGSFQRITLEGFETSAKGSEPMRASFTWKAAKEPTGQQQTHITDMEDYTYVPAQAL